MDMRAESTYSVLVEQLREYLGDHRYTEHEETDVPDIGTMYLIMTPRRWMVGCYICVVLDIPEQVSTVNQSKELFERIRSYLGKRYAHFPWWKELGTYVVLLCSHELYERLDGHMSQFCDQTGLHSNVMLGTVFVDREQLKSSAEATWGLLYSGKHFVDIRRVVREWCKQRLIAS